MRTRTFAADVVLARPREEVFAFFADAANLEALTPPWLSFEILTPRPIEMAEGTLIDYRLRLRGVPVRWRTRIAAWEPPRRFVDEQLRGPYRRWVHEHLFEEVPEGTRVVDRVEYAVPGGRLIDRIFVRPDVEKIFAFRHRELAERFGVAERPGELPAPPPGQARVSSRDSDPERRVAPIAAADVAGIGRPEEVVARLAELIEKDEPRARVAEHDRAGGRLHAVFRSRVFGFRDDLHAAADPEAGVVHLASASRRGVFDFGVNRRRVERLRRRLAGG